MTNQDLQTPFVFIELYLDRDYEAGDDSAHYPVSDFLGQCDLFVDSYLDVCLPHIETYIAMGSHAAWPITGGFVILADGTVVLDEPEEFTFYTEHWISPLTSLLEGSQQEQVMAWEGMQLTLTRKGEFITFEEIINPFGQLVCKQACFLFLDFIHAILEALKILVVLIHEIRTTIQERLSHLDPQKDFLKVACLKRLAEQFSDTWEETVTTMEALLLKQKRN